MTASTVSLDAPPLLLELFLTGYWSQRTQANYAFILGGFMCLDVTAGDEVAYAHALLRCGTPQELAEQPANRLRLTLGLRKQQGRWVVARCGDRRRRLRRRVSERTPRDRGHDRPGR